VCGRAGAVAGAGVVVGVAAGAVVGVVAGVGVVADAGADAGVVAGAGAEVNIRRTSPLTPYGVIFEECHREMGSARMGVEGRVGVLF
jgi:hypothetical protein